MQQILHKRPSGELSSDGIPLDVVIDDVNRYSDRRIVIGDAKLSQIRYTGRVHRLHR